MNINIKGPECLVDTALSSYGMVSTASPYATEAGVKILQKGGNAVDAAVAAAFCLGVSEPQASGLGGQSMVLLHHHPNGSPVTIALDGSSRAPFGIDPNNIPQKPLKIGILSTTVPSTPATLGYLLDTYGTMSLSEILEPAVEAAEKGFKLTSLQHRLVVRESEKLEDEAVRAIFFNNGRPLSAGEIVRQPQLAKSLRRLADAGWQDFYLGETSAKIIEDMQNRGGLISLADLHQVPLPVQREALAETYRDYSLATFPPPGAGRALIQILKSLEHFEPEELVPDTPLYYLLLAMVFRSALMYRENDPIDPALFPQFVEKRMVDKKSAETIALRIRSLLQYIDYSQYSPPATSGETTHLSVADSRGNAVGITQSIELVFGAKTFSGDLGFFYNNYMSAFNYKNMMHPNYLIPGGRPWSSVAPTLILREGGKPYLMLGSPGSERISTCLAQVITRIIDSGQSLAEAVNAPRIHAGSSGRVAIEKRGYRPEVVELLGRAGFQVKSRGSYSFYLGSIQAVELPETYGGTFKGVSDPRRDGSAAGPDRINCLKGGNGNS